MNVLITGISGFAGGHLVEFLQGLGREITISGTTFGPLGDFERRCDPEVVKRCYECDLTDMKRTLEVVQLASPDIVCHLAGVSSVADAWLDAEKVLVNNIIGELKIFEAVKHVNPEARVVIASSAEVYGKVRRDEVPITERNELRPNSPYAVSKLGQEFLGYQHFTTYGLQVITARSFNHIGPRQHGNFVIPSFIRQIAEIEGGKQEPVVRVGNLETYRDFCDVRDVVRAYWLLVTKGRAGEVYNICSGRAMQIKELLKFLLSQSTAEIAVEVDPARYRPADTPFLLGSHEKLTKKTGWVPEFEIESTLKETLGYWRNQLVTD